MNGNSASYWTFTLALSGFQLNEILNASNCINAKLKSVENMLFERLFGLVSSGEMLF